MNPPHSSFILLPSSLSFRRRPRLASGDRLFDHVLIDGDRAGAATAGIELQIANHAAERLTQSAGAEALLPRGIPGDGDQRAAGDLQVDAEALEIGARSAKNRRIRLDKNSRQVGLAEIVQDDNRFESRYELRRHAVAKEIFV